MPDKKSPRDLITTAEAGKLLGVSHDKMWKLLKNGTLRHYYDVRDLRFKWVSRRDVEALRKPRERAM
jgi:excisionase family DNA binding protein